MQIDNRSIYSVDHEQEYYETIQRMADRMEQTFIEVEEMFMTAYYNNEKITNPSILEGVIKNIESEKLEYELLAKRLK